MNSEAPGILVILSGPSGVGKTTIVRKLLALGTPPIELSISATTRSPRSGEQNGVDYHFLTKEEFERRQAAGEFLEFVEVFRTGHYYGTLRSEVEARLAKGISVLLEIDVEGAAKVAQQYPEAITIFLSPESAEELERRLRDRGTETEEAIQRRLETAKNEMEAAAWYSYRVLNMADAADNTVTQLADIIRQEKEKRCSKN
ncbi:guanylate kinase [Blastopirellula marina]|uniref:Guanylate kinase n=1 Tax=Blastopirellula marina TaxID=124 RepID=A0A2S8G1U6_9BACT|nr:guanylate kinase [Blastopirellula marina]PQO38241.1 guanylate kinase [Blastopirellula marina]PTL44897.1 guanylate kinase [Blastopirellula marina]